MKQKFNIHKYPIFYPISIPVFHTNSDKDLKVIPSENLRIDHYDYTPTIFSEE